MSTKKKPTKAAPEQTSRRDFFKTASLGVVGVAAAAVGTSVPEAKASETGGKDRGYQLTEHVKKAYQASRF